MNTHTLTLYSIASGLCFCLCLILAGFNHYRPDTPLARRSIVAILAFAIALFLAGNGAFLPSGVMVLGSNMLMLAAVVLLYEGLQAYCNRSLSRDFIGWFLVLSTAVPFTYWGLIEPNGIYRSVVYSLVNTLLAGRCAYLLLLSKNTFEATLPIRVLGLVFGVASMWMLGRSLHLLSTDTLPMADRGANPTHWITVFWFIILMSVLAIVVLWVEIDRLKKQHKAVSGDKDAQAQYLEPSQGNLILLWSLVGVFCLALVSELWIVYAHQIELISIQKFPFPGQASDLLQNNKQHMMFIALAAIAGIGTIILLATILTLNLRRKEMMRHHLRELEIRNSEQNQFMSMLSHELKTPLSVIRMSMVTALPRDSGQIRIHRAIDEIDAVVDRCLQSDRLLHGRIQLNTEPCEIENEIRQLVADLTQADRIKLDLAPLPICLIDIQLLKVIVSNLIDNALKYSPPGSVVTIRGEVEVARNGHQGTLLVFTNTVGSAGKPDPDKIFSKYYRAPGAHGKTGSGLGLHISSEFARMLNGELRYDNQCDDVVCFKFWLPVWTSL